jgi:hypothetical protein
MHMMLKEILSSLDMIKFIFIENSGNSLPLQSQ